MMAAAHRFALSKIRHEESRSRRSLNCVAALALILGSAQLARAQTPASPTAAQRSNSVAKVPAAHETAANTSSASSALNTGIRVHGHWTIDVLNRDGTLAKHVEFENALTLVGAEALPLILGRAATPGAWAIGLGYSQPGPSTGPCNQQEGYGFDVYTRNLGLAPAGWAFVPISGPCFIAEAVSAAGSPTGYPVACGSGVCFPSLNVSVVTVGTNVVSYTNPFQYVIKSAPQNQLQLQGIATAQNDGTIDTVATFLMLCAATTGSSTISPSVCATGPITTSSAGYANFGMLGGSGSAFEAFGQDSPFFGNSITAAYLTGSSATSTPPAPIGVLATQVLRVTVLLSFS
jgi:hypothetical protein